MRVCTCFKPASLSPELTHTRVLLTCFSHVCNTDLQHTSIRSASSVYVSIARSTCMPTAALEILRLVTALVDVRARTRLHQHRYCTEFLPRYVAICVHKSTYTHTRMTAYKHMRMLAYVQREECSTCWSPPKRSIVRLLRSRAPLHNTAHPWC